MSHCGAIVSFYRRASCGTAPPPAGGTEWKEGSALAVKRIVPNIAATDLGPGRAFYRDLFDLELVMDHGWIATFASSAPTTPQLSLASEGGSGTKVPDLSIEVDDVDEVHRRALAGGHEIVYDITDEPWGVRRFYLRDPFGKVLNVLSHRDPQAEPPRGS